MMNFKDLEFEAMGCCGGHVRAVVELSADGRLIVTDDGDGTYTVARMAGGLLNGGLLRSQTPAQVASLLE